MQLGRGGGGEEGWSADAFVGARAEGGEEVVSRGGRGGGSLLLLLLMSDGSRRRGGCGRRGRSEVGQVEVEVEVVGWRWEGGRGEGRKGSCTGVLRCGGLLLSRSGCLE